MMKWASVNEFPLLWKSVVFFMLSLEAIGAAGDSESYEHFKLVAQEQKRNPGLVGREKVRGIMGQPPIEHRGENKGKPDIYFGYVNGNISEFIFRYSEKGMIESLGVNVFGANDHSSRNYYWDNGDPTRVTLHQSAKDFGDKTVPIFIRESKEYLLVGPPIESVEKAKLISLNEGADGQVTIVMRGEAKKMSEDPMEKDVVVVHMGKVISKGPLQVGENGDLLFTTVMSPDDVRLWASLLVNAQR